MVVAIYAALLGALISGLTVAFADKWTSDKIVPNWVAVGALLGLMAGVLTGLLNLAAGARLRGGHLAADRDDHRLADLPAA